MKLSQLFQFIFLFLQRRQQYLALISIFHFLIESIFLFDFFQLLLQCALLAQYFLMLLLSLFNFQLN